MEEESQRIARAVEEMQDRLIPAEPSWGDMDYIELSPMDPQPFPNQSQPSPGNTGQEAQEEAQQSERTFLVRGRQRIQEAVASARTRMPNVTVRLPGRPGRLIAARTRLSNFATQVRSRVSNN